VVEIVPPPQPAAPAVEPLPTAPGQTPAAAYFADLTRLGIVDPRTGTQETLEAELAIAEAALERGDLGVAAATLYGIVDSPRFADFADSVAYQNAEYDLVVALAAGGASDEALVYAERVLRRGPKAQYFAVAHRRAVDVAINTRAYQPVLLRLEAIQLPEPLPTEAQSERAYLRGRAFYEAGDLDRAEAELSQVSRKSRLFSSAVYLRGVLRVRQGKLKDATDAFCEIAGGSDDDKLSFFIDDRYYALKDLARLGAARVAHEEGRFDDAYYHYFQIPDDSDRLSEALFEAAWSMYQKRELRTARELTRELLEEFPSAPQAPEGMLLAGYIELADCKFVEANQKFDALSKDLRPLVDTITRARAAAPERQKLLARALSRAQSARAARGPAAAAPPLSSSPEDRVLAMLRLDPRLLRLHDASVGLRREAAVAPSVVETWRDLSTRVPDENVAATPSDERVAETAFVARIRALRADIAREKQLLIDSSYDDAGEAAAARIPALDRADAQLASLADRLHQASSASGDPALKRRIAADLSRTQAFESRTRVLGQSFDRAADELASRELLRLQTGLVRIFEKARLGKIDAVIGEKRMYEKEIEDIAADRYMPRKVGQIYEHGLISDTEEYWPPEEEVWEDEYEGWR
jgi:TolA-binding protein